MTFPHLILLIALAAAGAFAHAAPVVKTEHVEAQLLAERLSAQPGKPALVGLRLRMAPHWHTYWKNPGDSGLPTKIKWTLPEGWQAGAIQWPYPKGLPVGPLLNYGYEDEVVLLTELTPPAGAKPGTVQLKAAAEWLVCKEVCIPEKGEMELDLAVAAGEAAVDDRWKASFERAKSALPIDLAGWRHDAAIAGRTLTLRITPPAGVAVPAKVTFFPERDNVIEHPAPQKLVRDGDALRIEMKLQDPPPKDLAVLTGVAVAGADWPGAGRMAANITASLGAPMAVLAGTTGGSGAGSELGGSVAIALAFAFLGGLLLNLMPCVFPVLGIKVMGFVEHAHGETRAMRVQGLVFTAGVVVSFLVLAGLMLALRAGGMQLGWGFQLQSPGFVTVLAGLFFLLALNLSGVYELGLFAQSMTSRISARGRYADAFLAGVLATVVATPCTAPFMGAAVGFTLSQPAAVSLSVFLAIAVGLALPVLLLAYFPAALRLLPKPGAWMETFKQVLAFPLYATVAWLVWVLGAQSGNDAVLGMLAGLVSLAIAVWIYGRWSRSESFWRPAFALAFGALGLYLAYPGPADAPAPAGAPVAKADELPWQAWSPEKVAQLTANGQTVFVDFTASWCVTCQVNKRLALNKESVVKAFAERGVVPLKADWTNADPRITAALAELGRNSLPVYALYTPGASAPRLLPEILTPSLIIVELEKLPLPKTATALNPR